MERLFTNLCDYNKTIFSQLQKIQRFISKVHKTSTKIYSILLVSDLCIHILIR